ncbi:MAG: molybdopterin-dependent oxidoreductase, partial [Planctomycetes bacterium]|nr:molybdopterin-dependent oxidoreductase [Planctomycetota bacterium]
MGPSGSPASLPRAKETLSFTLNGRAVALDVDPERSLLDVLRDEFGIISPKIGCAPQAACGCCTVLVDGRPRLSCVTKATRVAGQSVTTLEGLSEQQRRQIAESFVRAGGVQCGYCTPGIAMRVVALLDKNAQPSRAEIAQGLRLHLCRCTGYKKIIDAIELLARVRRGEGLPPADASGKVGTRLDRYRGKQLVLGDFRYVNDIQIDGMLFAAPRFSDHPRALVKSIDIAPALTLPGVRRVLTAADVPGQRYIGLIEQDWPILVAIGEETRCVGDMLAIVVADDQHIAREAAERIVVEYEVRKPVISPEEALQPDAPKIHAGGNLLSRSTIRRGDVGGALRESAHVVEGTYTTQRVEHMYLEPESCVAVQEPRIQGAKGPRDRGEQYLAVFSQGQGVFDDRGQIAAVLGWDLERVQVELVSNGGAFGGKEDNSIQAQTALAAALCNAPVKCTLTREESFRLHPKRHPMRIDISVGCDRDGHLTGLRARI